MSDSSRAAPAWVRAVAALRGGGSEEVAARVIEAAAEDLGAHSAAAVDLGAATALATWHCRAADVAPLLAPDGALTAALARDVRWPGAPVVYRPPSRGESGAAERGLLAAPLPMGRESIGALLFFFQGVVPDQSSAADRATGFADLLASALEHGELIREARGAREARDHFLVSLHHELRTPATALMLDAGILQAGGHGQLPDRMAGALQRVESHAAELIRVAGRVLDLAWLEAGEAPSLNDLVDPRQQVLEVLRGVEPSVKRKGLRLTVYLPKALPCLQTDRERFSRVLLHLLSNAVKFTERGGIEVRLERKGQGERAGRRELLAIRIADTGTGIPESDTERVFEPFVQVEEGARTDTPTRGLGMGLPLARKLARSLGGDVRIERSGEEGTTLAFLLPFGAAQAEAEPA